jgi:NAD(P)H-dependent flavin oxidoreductase YrpB (nitropropane dioxygenase family)
MAGGPSTPGLVRAAAAAGHFAQLAAGYRTAEQLDDQVREVRRAGVEGFGVNLFVPNPSPVDPAAYRRYAAALAPTARRLGVTTLPDCSRDIIEDDDGWDAKVALLVEDPVPVVSFTFGLPSARTVARLRARGTVTLQTVTSPVEAREAVDRGIDALVVQGAAAGGHSGILDPAAVPPDVPLPDLVRAVVAASRLPVVAAGGIGTADDVAAALSAGAAAVAVGTAVLRTPESGASAVHQAALGDPAFERTVLTRAFTGRPARALVNRFVTELDAVAPVGYPALHHLTRPVRTAATAAGDPSAVNLWAGRGWQHARVEPVATVLARLAAGV